MEYLESHPQDLESTYPYHGLFHLGCHEKPGVVSVVNYTKVPSNSSAQLKAAIAAGPTSVTIDANSIEWYRGGIFNNPKCGIE
jgi:hypothetical protein